MKQNAQRGSFEIDMTPIGTTLRRHVNFHPLKRRPIIHLGGAVSVTWLEGGGRANEASGPRQACRTAGQDNFTRRVRLQNGCGANKQTRLARHYICCFQQFFLLTVSNENVNQWIADLGQGDMKQHGVYYPR